VKRLAPGSGVRDPRAGIGWWRASRIAFVGSLGRPGLWPFALLGFLLRGGWFLFLLPIVVVPSTVGVATFIGPLAVTPAGPSDGFLRFVAAVIGGLVAWILVGGLVAGACEAFVVLESSSRAGHGRGARRVRTGLAARVLSARIMAAIPLVVAIAWSIPRVVGATYSELTAPADPALPVPVRVLRDLPDAIVVVVVAWIVAETIGALAARKVVLSDESALAAIGLGLAHLVRRPLSSIATAGSTLIGSIVIVGPALVLAGVAWDQLAGSLPGQDGLLPALVSSVAFVLAWGAALLVAAVASSWRSIAWTLEVVRLDRRDAAARAPLPAAARRIVESGGTSAVS
jgi:hypothetical protein